MDSSSMAAAADTLREKLATAERNLEEEAEKREALASAMAARDAEFTTSRTSNDELKAIVATLEQSVADADAKASRLEAAAAAAAAASRDQMESLRQEMLADKDEALKMLEDNFEEEMARKDEENELNWKSFAASSVEEQSLKLKGEAEAREACEADAACLSIYDQSCDGSGQWRTCRSASGLSSSSGSCLYVVSDATDNVETRRGSDNISDCITSHPRTS